MRMALRVPKGLLTSHRKDVLMLLRIGAGVNSMEAEARALMRVPRDGASVSWVDGQILLLEGIAHFGEIVKRVKKAEYLDRFCELSGKGLPFHPAAQEMGVTLNEVRVLLSPLEQPATRDRALLRVRDRVSFHWD